MTATSKEQLTMRLTVDPERCQGHTVCAMTAPELFTLSDTDGHSTATVSVVPPELHDKARRAAIGCPEQAVIITEGES